MSRSRKRTPILSITTSTSEKEDKTKGNRSLRRSVHMICDDVTKEMIIENDEVDIEFPKVREVSDVWGFSKDGKRYNPPGDYLEKYMRK